MARGRERQLEDQIAQLHEALRAAQEAAEAAEASAQAVAARAFSADERRQLKEALEAAQRRADELSAQSSTMQARLSIRSEAAEAAAGAARHELMLKEHKLAELQARACDLEPAPDPSLNTSPRSAACMHALTTTPHLTPICCMHAGEPRGRARATTAVTLGADGRRPARSGYCGRGGGERGP